MFSGSLPRIEIGDRSERRIARGTMKSTSAVETSNSRVPSGPALKRRRSLVPPDGPPIHRQDFDREY